jgi:hypothetical protein
MREIKYVILYLVPVPELRFRFWLFNKLRFRFRSSKSYGAYGSGSTTLLKIKKFWRVLEGQLQKNLDPDPLLVRGMDPHSATMVLRRRRGSRQVGADDREGAGGGALQAGREAGGTQEKVRTVSRAFGFYTVLWIRITLMRIRIRLITLMRIRIKIFNW